MEDTRAFRDLHVVVTGSTGELGGVVASLLIERGAHCTCRCVRRTGCPRRSGAPT
jgi:hypothetical protein